MDRLLILARIETLLDRSESLAERYRIDEALAVQDQIDVLLAALTAIRPSVYSLAS